jgi:hypothetical protein
MMKTFGDAHYAKLPAEQKYRFMVTFNANEEIRAKIIEEFKKFIAHVESLVTASPSEATYQLNFDIFKWF